MGAKKLRQRHALTVTTEFRKEFVEWIKSNRIKSADNVVWDLEHGLRGVVDDIELYFFSIYSVGGTGYWVSMILEFIDARSADGIDRSREFKLTSVSFEDCDQIRASVIGKLDRDPFNVTMVLNIRYTIPDEIES